MKLLNLQEFILESSKSVNQEALAKWKQELKEADTDVKKVIATKWIEHYKELIKKDNSVKEEVNEGTWSFNSNQSKDALKKLKKLSFTDKEGVKKYSSWAYNPVGDDIFHDCIDNMEKSKDEKGFNENKSKAIQRLKSLYQHDTKKELNENIEIEDIEDSLLEDLLDKKEKIDKVKEDIKVVRSKMAELADKIRLSGSDEASKSQHDNLQKKLEWLNQKISDIQKQG